MNKNLILPIAILMIVFSVFLVSAAVSMELPDVGTNHSSTMAINCTESTLPALLNSTIMYNASGGASEWDEGDTSLVLVSTVNTTDNETYISAQSISSLSDATTYNISCWFFNGTDPETVADDIEFAGSAASITIDNTACVGTATFTESKVGYGRQFTYNTSLTDATSGVETSSCQIADPFGKYTGTVTITDTDKTFTESTRTDGIWNITCNGTDYAGNACTFSDTVTVSAAGNVITEEDIQPSKFQGLIDKIKEMDKKLLILIIGIIVLLAWMSLKKK